MKFSKNSLITFIFTSPHIILAYIIKLFIANYFGPEGVGDITLITNYVNWISFAGVLGLSISNVYFYNRDHSKMNIIYWNSTLFILILSAFLIFIYFVMSPVFLKKVSPYLVKAAFPMVAFALYIDVMKSTLAARLWFIRFGIAYILPIVLNLTFIIFLVMTGNFTVLNTIYSIVFSYFFTFLFCFFSSRKGVEKQSTDLGFLWKSIKYGMRGHIGNIFQKFNYRLDFYIIQWFKDVSTVGYYGISTAIAEGLLFIPRSISTVLLPVVSSFEDDEESYIYTSRVCRVTFFIVSFTGLLLLIFGRWLIIIFFPDFMKSVIPMYLLVPGLVFLSLANVLANFFSGRGSPEIAAYGSLTALIMTVIFDIVLIPKYGIIGASIASSISYITCAGVFVYFFIKRTKLPITSFIIITKGDINYLIKMLKQRYNGNSSRKN
ncbi:polysaccharide biosynthesis C-terminal domain-containing protein [candidate division KSB1 bacterium]